MKRSQRASGFTLIEVVIVMAMVVPILLVIGSASRAAIGSFNASDRSAAKTQIVLRALAQAERALRFGSRETLRTPATADDVRLRRGTTVGQWISMPSREPRTSIQLTSLAGGDAPELAFPRVQHGLAFVPDKGEVLDGLDNDRDGMVDEGSLRFTRGADTYVLIDRVEQCTFELEGSCVHIVLRCVLPSSARALQRTTLRHTVFMINP